MQKYQDNLEFMQWFKRFYEMSAPDRTGYDLAGSRLRGKGILLYPSVSQILGWFSFYFFCWIHACIGGAEFNTAFSRGGNAGAASENAPPIPVPRHVAGVPAKSSAPTSSKMSGPTSTTTARRGNAEETTRPASITASAAVIKSGTKVSSSSSAGVVPVMSRSEVVVQSSEIAELKIENERIKQSFDDLRLEMDGLEKERNFYFDKLRDVEMMLQDVEDSGKGTELTASIFKILYATADGFDRVAEDAVADVTPIANTGAVDGEEDETF